MCYLSVQCACRHNIAIQNPNKECIRPRHPKGCWLIRRGEPVSSRCPGCVEYFSPTTEQLTWNEVMAYHLDTSIDWSEATLSNVITADRNRHINCEYERLDFRRRLRWKLMVKWGLLPGWKLAENGAMVPISNEMADDTVGNGADVIDINLDDETKQQLAPLFDVAEDGEHSSGEMPEEDVGDLTIGYALKRVSSGRLETVFEDPLEIEGRANVEMEENDEANESFQLTSPTNTSTSSSNGSTSGLIIQDLGIDDLALVSPPPEIEDVLPDLPPSPQPKPRELMTDRRQSLRPRIGLTDEWLRNIIPWRSSPSGEEASTENGEGGLNGNTNGAQLHSHNHTNGSGPNFLLCRSSSPQAKAGEGQPTKSDTMKESTDEVEDTDGDGVDGGVDGADDDQSVSKRDGHSSCLHS
ncbi:hypothetical protein Dda_1656 [Drechslerella dactyloides]|uniref:Uncharacterized protein n=1 Tax=Drechslerella dactyloides TaxID=74499 RepID=A0AAD6J6H6_DREDA|nr:hypothetical protein Dda_1656 [Drechslerella dactyloides]